MSRKMLAIAVVVCRLSFAAVATADDAKLAPLDLLVVAPHSDDEAIGCTAVVLRAAADGKRVGIVVVTAGDGHVRAAAAAAGKSIDDVQPADFVNLAALRQRHTLEAMPRLGVRPADIFFLGYPDGGLAAMDEADDGAAPFRHPHTRRTTTYGPVVADYHTLAHGESAPYVRQAVIDDLAELIRTRKPQTIYTTHEIDTHADHRTTFRFVRDAARAAGFGGTLQSFVVHGRAPPQPADVRLELTADELQTKRTIIELYQAGVSPVHDRLAEEYARPDELFWTFRLAAEAKSD